MEKSVLQQARAAYKPKLPKALQGNVKVKEGAPTQSVDNQEDIKALFPNTYGMPLVEFVPGDEALDKRFNVGIILSGGQAPGGHNVICGLFDTVKKLNPDNKLYGFLMVGHAPGRHNVTCGPFDTVKHLTPDINPYGFITCPGGLVSHAYM